MSVKIFYAMPFSGFTFDQIVATRTAIATECETHGVRLIEQFIGHEQADLYSWHGYQPSYIVAKDFALIQESDVVIADFSSPSVGRDYEVVASCEVFDKPVIAIVPDALQRQHPWVRLYSRYIVENRDAAFRLACELGPWLGAPEQRVRQLCRRQGQLIKRLLPTELLTRWRELFVDEFDSRLAILGMIDEERSESQSLCKVLASDGFTTVRTSDDLGSLKIIDGKGIILFPESSEEGRFWLEPKRAMSWQLHRVIHHSARQRALLAQSFDLLSRGQELVYVTTSLAPEENELIIDSLLRDRGDAELIPVDYFTGQSCRIDQWGHIRCSETATQSRRVYPSRSEPLGYHVAKVRRN